MVFVRDNISSKMIIEKLPAESFLIELNLRKKRWLVNCFYNPNNGNIESYLNSISKSLDIHLNRYEKLILLRDYNASTEDLFLKNFSENYDLRSFIKETTCFKIPENPSCTDLILTNKR